MILRNGHGIAARSERFKRLNKADIALLRKARTQPVWFRGKRIRVSND